MEPPIEQIAHQWLRQDKDARTKAEIRGLLDAGNVAELEKCLRTRMIFGTAGLRAAMGAGYSRMNSLTIVQTSQGLAEYVLKTVPDAQSRGIVIGHDARHNSELFAHLAISAFIASGIRVWFLGQIHTPMIPFTVNKCGAAAGVVVTASHNPAIDNGYKVYWDNGCQIIPPHDRGIAEAIEQNLEPLSWHEGADTQTILSSPLVTFALPIHERSYYQAVAKAASRFHGSDLHEELAFVYTAMHGVGHGPFIDAMTTLAAESLQSEYKNFKLQMIIVKKQCNPDPDFPTVRFPNPEEKGALDLAKQVADEHDINLILANDPDADRFAVAVKDHGIWRQITGNQLGVLLASQILDERAYSENVHNEDASPSTNSNVKKLAVLCSTVSSRMLSRMAAATPNCHFEETLTGFKWLGNKAQELAQAGYEPVFAYEEALGYMFPSVVWDKDGIAAAMVFISAARRWKKMGLTPWEKLQELYQQYGYFEEANTYLVSPSPAVTNAVFDRIRATSPTHVGERRINRWRDLTVGYDSATPDHEPLLPVDGSAQMITVELEGDVTCTIRGSGTEPKIKLYIEGCASSSQAAKTAADSVLQDIVREWFQPEKNGLRLA